MAPALWLAWNYAAEDSKAGARIQHGGQDFAARFAQQKEEMLLAHMADGTRTTYSLSWTQWLIFCRIMEVQPYLEGETKAERRSDEELLLDFVVHLGGTLKKAAGTVKQRVFGVRYRHIQEGRGDPLVGKVRLWLALKGLARLQGASERKFPVTAQMLLWIRKRLNPRLRADDAVIWATLVTAWLFLMRASEYCWSNGWDQNKVLTGHDVVARREGNAVKNLRNADGVMV